MVKLNKVLKFFSSAPSDKVKWGIIGTGNMADTFSKAIKNNKDCQISAVASRKYEKAKKFASKHSVKNMYGSYQEMIADNNLELDIIYIATPAKYHYEHIKMCLEAKKNVLCEKPMVTSMGEMKELSDLAKENGCFLMEGMWMQCLPTMAKADEWIRCGRIGKVELVKADFYKMEKIDPARSIFSVEEGGGVLRDFGVYAISFMNKYMNGECVIRNVYKRCRNGIDADWNIVAENSLGVKAILNLSSNFLSQSKAAIVGSNGSIVWNHQFNRTNEVSLYDVNGNKIEDYSAKYICGGFEFQVNEVVICLSEGRKESRIVPLKLTTQCTSIIEQLLSN